MILLVDIGNTRIKWTLCRANWVQAFFAQQDKLALLQQSQALETHDLAAAQAFFATPQPILTAGKAGKAGVGLPEVLPSPFLSPVFALDLADLAAALAIWARLPLEKVCISSVAATQTAALAQALRACFGETLALQLADISMPLADFRHAYRQKTLGVDRFLSALAVHALTEQAAIVACAGTALTIDAVAGGQFLGGSIAPGWRLMRESLAKNAEQLDILSGQWDAFPTRTADAIFSGCINAMTAPILAARTRLAAQLALADDAILVFISGGDAAILAAHLSVLSFEINNLVLIGLARTA